MGNAAADGTPRRHVPNLTQAMLRNLLTPHSRSVIEELDSGIVEYTMLNYKTTNPYWNMPVDERCI